MTKAQWDAMHQTILAAEKENSPPEETKDGKEATPAKKKEAPKHPEVDNPMKFDSAQKKTDKQHSAAWAECQQNLGLSRNLRIRPSGGRKSPYQMASSS